MTINYNEFAQLCIDNRDFSFSLTNEDMTRKEWDKYRDICDNVAKSGYKFLSGKGTFEDYRAAIHALFSFMGIETRILALDGNVMQFNRCIPYIWVKSKEYKEADSAVRKFKRAMKWALEVSGVEEEQDSAAMFPKADSVKGMEEHYFTAEDQDNYNACIALFKTALGEDRDLTVKDMKLHLDGLEEKKTALVKTPRQYFKDYKNPLKSGTGKDLRHVSIEVRKCIEDALADMLTNRMTMTQAMVDKENAQIKGGRKVANA